MGIPLKEEEQKEDNTNVVLSKGMYTCIEDIIKAHPDKEFKWLLGKDYRIVDDEHLEEICDYIMNWDGYVYYDTETTGLQINFLSRVQTSATGSTLRVICLISGVRVPDDLLTRCSAKW